MPPNDTLESMGFEPKLDTFRDLSSPAIHLIPLALNG